MKLMARFLLVAAVAAGSVCAQPSSTTPLPRDARWLTRSAANRALARQDRWEIVFIGDSITDSWRATGKEIWDKYFAPYHALNLGIRADRTEHVLWRLDHGEMDGVNPKLIVLMIGTNNTKQRPADQESTADTVAGIKAILDRLGQKAPQAKVLLLAIFPCGATPQNRCRVRNEAVNAEIKKFADNRHVFWININDKLLQPDGTLSRDMMPDLLHPSAKGYVIWAEAIMPLIKETMGK